MNPVRLYRMLRFHHHSIKTPLPALVRLLLIRWLSSVSRPRRPTRTSARRWRLHWSCAGMLRLYVWSLAVAVAYQHLLFLLRDYVYTSLEVGRSEAAEWMYELEGVDRPQILHEIADRTCDFLRILDQPYSARGRRRHSSGTDFVFMHR